MKDFFIAALSIISSILIVIVLVGFGWYIVWKAFFSRFTFVRELLGGMSETSTQSEPKQRPRRVRREY